MRYIVVACGPAAMRNPDAADRRKHATPLSRQGWGEVNSRRNSPSQIRRRQFEPEGEAGE